jgi:hypothetical protein
VKKLVVIFTDCKKASDSMRREEIWKSLEKVGISTNILRKVKYIKKRLQSVLRQIGAVTMVWDQMRSQKRICIITNIDYVTMNITCNKVREKIKEADDIIIWGKYAKEPETRLSQCERASKEYGLEINLEKTYFIYGIKISIEVFSLS